MSAVVNRVFGVRVRFQDGTYKVRSRGKSASCTWSGSEAVRRLATKLDFKPGFDVVLTGQEPEGITCWNIVEVQP